MSTFFAFPKKSAVMYGVLTVLFLALVGCSSNTTAKAKDMPAEQKLAILDANTFVDTTDMKVVRMKVLLDDLSADYNQPRDTIADYTSRAQGVLQDRGIKESCLNILEEMHKAGKIENTKYSEAITMYLMVRDKQ